MVDGATNYLTPQEEYMQPTPEILKKMHSDYSPANLEVVDLPKEMGRLTPAMNSGVRLNTYVKNPTAGGAAQPVDEIESEYLPAELDDENDSSARLDT